MIASTTVAARMYPTAITGTNAAANRPIHLIPPRITTPATTAITTPATRGSSRNVPCSASATEFACDMFPIPNAAIAVATAKNSPRNFPTGPPTPSRR